jgi:hypothetical protein
MVVVITLEVVGNAIFTHLKMLTQSAIIVEKESA